VKAGKNYRMTSENSASAPFRFTVESVFTITGRGTAVIGYIQAGTIRTGDMLKVIRKEGDLTTSCKGVESVCRPQLAPKDPVPVGLLLDLDQSQITAGDIITKDTQS
jgi:translation elongation factor EF-Tu-like GTPase